MATAPVPVGMSQAELNEMFAKLLADAELAKTQYLRTKCPPFLQDNLTDYLATQPVPPSGPTQVVISNGQSIVVHALNDSNVAGSPGTAVVAAGVLTKVMLTV